MHCAAPKAEMHMVRIDRIRLTCKQIFLFNWTFRTWGVGILRWLLPVIGLLLASTASGQTPNTPSLIENGIEVRGSANPPGEGGMIGCYAVNTRPGETLRVKVVADGFGGELLVARGARCDAAALQVRKMWKLNEEPGEIVMKVPGGRYLVLINRAIPTAKGTYRLSINVANETVAIKAQRSDPGEAPVPAAQAGTASGATDAAQLASASPPPKPVSARKAMMEAQIAQRELELAIAEERRLEAEELARQRAEQERIAAEERAYQESLRRAQEAENDRIIGQALAGVARGVGAALADNLAADYAAGERQAQARIAQSNVNYAALQRQSAAAEAAQARTAEQRRIAEEKMARAQEQMRLARQQQQSPQAGSNGNAAGGNDRTIVGHGSGIGGAGTAGRGGSAAPATEIITMMEGVVVCPLNPDRAKLFGESTCYGPFQNGLSDPGKAYDMQIMCGDSDGSVRDLGTYGNNRVWGCNYGINPRKSGSPNVDQAARFNLIIPSRRTFRCDAKIDGYCRSQ